MTLRLIRIVSLFVLAAVAIAASMLLTTVSIPTAIPMPDVSFNDHALDTHGSEASRVRNCMRNNGPFMVFREGRRFHLLCREDDGTIADMIIERVNDVWEEITSFEPKQTSNLTRVKNWLERKGTTRVKSFPW